MARVMAAIINWPGKRITPRNGIPPSARRGPSMSSVGSTRNALTPDTETRWVLKVVFADLFF